MRICYFLRKKEAVTRDRIRWVEMGLCKNLWYSEAGKRSQGERQLIQFEILAGNVPSGEGSDLDRRCDAESERAIPNSHVVLDAQEVGQTACVWRAWS